MEQQLKQYIASVDAQSGRKITVNGLSFDVYVRRQWDEYNNQKETEKRHRVCWQSALSLLTVFGSRPSDHYFRSVCLFVCLFVQSFSQPFLIRFRSN